ncbi:alpha-tocopherol transfer protein-like [Diabrotica virgifera virgifera]|uniref:CRAL-TRIO domain-containing protein n=1 Tax=Diabrotica virgifera virgifera TaxID=50390 RepID=A0ABM5JVH0_DIAVI|nr:alpha-tocopherol transfer protein-like [Diabrotica virgifera virgifera]
MGDTSILITDREQRLKAALQSYQKTERNLEEYITVITNWFKTQRHIPEIPERNMIINFLLMNKFVIQSTKEKLEMYYSIRTIIPEFFQGKHPCSDHMQKSTDKIYFIPLPKVTERGYRVVIIKCKESPENFHVCDFFAHTYNVSEIRLNEDVAVGDILVYDFENLKVGHFLKITPVIIKKSTIVLEKVFSNRVKQIHILNTPTYASTTIAISKKMMKPKIASRIHIHKKSASIFKYIPMDILPKDYGGNEKPLEELNQLWKAKLAEYKERFDALEKIRIKEELKPMPLINDEILGFHGNFRKLDLD